MSPVAAEPIVNNPRGVFEAVVLLTLRLADEYGVGVDRVDLPVGIGGGWDKRTRTVRIPTWCDIDDQFFLLSDAFRLVAVGVHATRCVVETRPMLMLVPRPRNAS